MKFSVNTGALAGGLKTVGRAISSKSILPVLENALIEAKAAGVLAVAGTNLEIGLRTYIPAQVEEPGEITLPARLLQNLMSTWNGPAETRAVLDAKTKTLNMTCDGATAAIKGIPAQEFPIIPDPSDWTAINLDPYALRGALDRVVFAAATAEARPILTGVYIHTELNAVMLAAADGYRMSSVRMDVDLSEIETPVDKGIIVPSDALRELARLIPGAGKPVRVCFKPGQLAQIAFVTFDRDGDPETVLVSQLINGQFPDYRQIIPKETNLTVRADTHALTNAIQGAMVFAAHGANIVRLYAKDSELAVVGTSSEMGHQDATIPVETHGTMHESLGDDDKKCGRIGKIAINGKYALDALRAVDAAETEIALLTPSSPLVMRPVDDDSLTIVIMPMHLGS